MVGRKEYRETVNPGDYDSRESLIRRHLDIILVKEDNLYSDKSLRKLLEVVGKICPIIPNFSEYSEVYKKIENEGNFSDHQIHNWLSGVTEEQKESIIKERQNRRLNLLF